MVTMERVGEEVKVQLSGGDGSVLKIDFLIIIINYNADSEALYVHRVIFVHILMYNYIRQFVLQIKPEQYIRT